jgi:NitT/TauT family transport system permease protein
VESLTSPKDAAAEAPIATSGARRRSARARRRPNRYLYTIGSVIAGLGIWQLVGLYVVHNSLFLATPTQAFAGMIDLWRAGQLQLDVIVSAEEFAIGFVMASLVGIAIGLLTASFERVNLVAAPWIAGF